MNLARTAPEAAPKPGARLRATWAQLAPRERTLVALAAATVLLALLWLLALAPALRTLRQAPAERAGLAAQAQQLQQLKAEAQALKALPRLSQDEAQRALQATTTGRLGSAAQLSLVGDRANVVLKQAPADALARWLADARANARATPVEARLTRGGDNTPGAPVLWSGTLVLSLPGA